MAKRFLCLSLLMLLASALPGVASSQPPPYLLQFGTPGNGNGLFSYPLGAATDAAGNVYVVDWLNDYVQKFTSTGAFITQWGTPGTGNGQLNHPYAVAVDPTGNVYVAEEDNNRIQKFTGSGIYIAKWGTLGAGAGQFNNPIGVATDAAGNVYVADHQNHRIDKFTGTGAYIGQWTAPGLDYPYGVATDASGNVYVTDDCCRVWKFTNTGVYISQWGTQGTGNGQLKNPIGVAADTAGNIYVADYLNNRVQKFTNAGSYITQWGTSGAGNGQFSGPVGVATAPGGIVYVTDRVNDRVQAFGPQGAVCQGVNVALGRPATASATYPGYPPSRATDGDILSLGWGAGDYPPQWIEIDLGQEIPVHCIRLLVDMRPDGAVAHDVTGRTAAGASVPLGSFVGPAVDRQWLSILSSSATPVRYVRVTTTASPSWVGWIEIEVLADGTALPRVTVLSPNGGEVWPIGSTQTVRWQASADVGVTSVDIDYSVDGGASFPGTLASGLVNTGAYTVTVPIAPTTQARIRVTAHDNASNTASDVSDRNFVIPGNGPTLTRIADVGNDQGRQVRATWARSDSDQPTDPVPIVRYDIFRRIDPLPPVAGGTPRVPRARVAAPDGVMLADYDFVASVPAACDDEYSMVVPTLADSNLTGMHWSVLMVRAATGTPSIRYDSAPDSGYSVDNLVPLTPQHLAVSYANRSAVISWSPNTDADLLAYRVYGGPAPDFVPGPANLLATTGNTEYVHGDPMLCYKVTAVDWNGNESVPALLVTPLDAPLGAGALRFELEGAWPNPVVGARLVVGFILPVAMPATVDLLDVSGRRIVSRQVGALGVGRHAVDLLEGKGLASGLFVVRLTQGANVKTQRVVVVR